MIKIQNVCEKQVGSAREVDLALFIKKKKKMFPPLKERVHFSRCFGFLHPSSKLPSSKLHPEPEHTQTKSSSHREKVDDPVCDFKQKTERENGAVY